MATYAMERIHRWIGDIQNLIPLVAEYRGKIVGYATINKFAHPRRKEVSDLELYLHQNFHDVGLGTAMTKKLLRLARREEMHKIELQVVVENNNRLRPSSIQFSRHLALAAVRTAKIMVLAIKISHRVITISNGRVKEPE